ncbi:unnamed protein product [Phaedon cochleariae]|uniref:Uncharacterized protein n=1 Tax=Phaedon cochleariae TaxID=80249 RepID=A0A9P0GPU5_PHACE|nr:unnamed protein product [Phaedon cochleariae]
MSVFEQLCTITPKMQATLENIDATLKSQIQDIFAPLQKFIETGDRSFLDKEFEKENIASSATIQKRTRQQKPTVLEEISENSLQFENVKVKQEKLSIASSESTCSVSSETFLKEISPKGRRTRQKKPSVSENSETLVIETVKVKKEKISTIMPPSSSHGTCTSEATLTDADIEIKKEDMPAPRKLPPRKKKIKPELEETQKRSTRAFERGKQSDVILQNTTITKIDITETDSDTSSEKKSHVKPEQPVQQNMRATRSKVRQRKPSLESQSDNEKVETSEPEIKKVRSTRTKTLRQNKRNRSHSEELEAMKNEKKKSKSSTSSDTEDNKSAQTEYEDAVSTMETNETEPQSKADATYVAKSEPQSAVLNQTVVIEKPKVVQPSDNKEVVKENGVRTPPRPKSKKQTKEIFSPFDKTPLKKKVEAFEKLEAAAMQQGEAQNAKGNPKSETKTSTGRPKSKLVTPFTSRFMPKTCSTSKINKLYPGNKLDTSTSGDSALSAKSVSVLKASQAEFREREKRRQEKEREALKKREALLAAQAEEKKRKREEKQLKAQQQRELLEKDKQKQLEEQQRKDEEKYKQAIAEKQEKMQKQREEAEKKRLVAKEKAQLIKLQEERDAKEAAERDARAAAKKEEKLKSHKAKQHGLPVYMVSKPPLLPTDDCYDSDCSDYGADYTTPEWAKEKALEKKQMVQIVAQEKLKNTFFCRKTHTPDLQEIFEIIDPRKLKRTSSAVWKKPPRYTLFSVTSIVQFSDDEDVDV